MNWAMVRIASSDLPLVEKQLLNSSPNPYFVLVREK
jgi:hypothetical protein